MPQICAYIYIYIILILVCSFSSLLYFSHIDCNAFYVERGIYLDAPLLTGMSLICSRRKCEIGAHWPNVWCFQVVDIWLQPDTATTYIPPKNNQNQIPS